MTTYTHTITLNDSQRIALEAALEIAIGAAQEEIRQGNLAPATSRLKCYGEIASKLASGSGTALASQSGSAASPR